ncbi:hypothetical protein [Alkalibacterium sp. 20]|uniref:hypothetical protein n=1 Tax=Alkalibacterium sp. 20 TaxID=1798803 RepID=UPI000B324D9A|nr:hypothetical protein [Alkalibacterium sp. 20]
MNHLLKSNDLKKEEQLAVLEKGHALKLKLKMELKNSQVAMLHLLGVSSDVN